jgi:ATP-binding cassette subfamily C (CFTR/MRP) protein 1
VLLSQIVSGIECRASGGDGCATNNELYFYALCMTLAGVLQNLCQAQQDYALQRLGVRVRNRLMCALYRKAGAYTRPLSAQLELSLCPT